MTRRVVLFGAILCLAGPGLGVAAPSRGVHRFDIIALSPDGARVASVEGDVPADGGDPPSERLVIRDVASGATQEVALPCQGQANCVPGWPAWTPDGTRLAFTLPIPGGHARAVYTVAAAGGPPAHLLDFSGTLSWLRYGPDGQLTALAIDHATKEAGATKAGAAAVGDLDLPPHEQRIARLAPSGVAWASPPELNVYEYDFQPDGRGFVGTAAPGDGDAHWWQAKLYAFDTAGAHLLYAPGDAATQLAEPKVSPDGRAVSFIGGLMSDYDAVGGDAFVLPLDQPGATPADVTPKFTGTVTSLAWACRRDRLLATVLTQERTQVVTLTLDGHAPEVSWSGAETLTGNDSQVLMACGDGTLATIHEDFAHPEEIAVRQGGWRDLTAANAGLAAPVGVRNVVWRNEGLPGQGWLLLPAGAREPADAAAAPPKLITVVHGGPAFAAQPTFLGAGYDRALLDHGFALFLPNPRGSYGQGEDFTRATMRDLGHGDLRDILAGVEAALAAAPLDGQHVGVTGVSYGGFMTMWAGDVAQRFQAGVAIAGISDWLSYAGTAGTVGWLLPYFGASVYDDPAVYARSSPLGMIRQAHMPILALVGGDDIECPPTQTIAFWRGLRAVGVPTAAVVYPGEGHRLRDPAHVADAAARAIDWFDKYLR